MRSMKPFRRLSVQLFDLLHHAVSRSSEIERDSVRFAVDVHFPRIWRFHIIRRRKRRDLARRLLAGVLFFLFFVVDVLPLLLLFVPEVALGRGGRAQHASRRVHVDGTFDAPDPDCMSHAIFWGKRRRRRTRFRRRRRRRRTFERRPRKTPPRRWWWWCFLGTVAVVQKQQWGRHARR